MKKYSLIILLFFTWVVLSGIYYVASFVEIPSFTVFLSVATFLFSIFAGFFIARQGTRYSQIRDLLSEFDGQVSVIYRFSTHLDKKTHLAISNGIKNEYQRFIAAGDWDAPIAEKTNFITTIHEQIEKLKKKKQINIIESTAIGGIFVALHNLQPLRKRLIALQQEKIPLTQWVLIYFLALILLTILSSLQAEFSLVASIYKASFGTVIILVLFMLKKFERLEFFESTIGETSAQDVLDIIEGKK